MEIGILILKGIENMNITSKECYHQYIQAKNILSRSWILNKAKVLLCIMFGNLVASTLIPIIPYVRTFYIFQTNETAKITHAVTNTRVA
jgi:hypothetical protein